MIDPATQQELLKTNQLIHVEADEMIYKQGLHKILSGFGLPHYTGSYALQLMTWRDLDIYLETENISEEKFFELGASINKLLHPVKMSFRNERIARTKDLPNGLYWGIYLGNERAGSWKIDIWAMDKDECKQRLKYCDELATKISAEDRIKILEIKSKCWTDPLYRKSYSSSDIYSAVLENRIENFEQFASWVKKVF